MTEISTVFVEGTPRLAVDRAGSGPLVFFLHGIGGNRTNWTAQIEALRDSFHAVAWDARGYGDSDDYEGPLDFGDFARDALRVLDRFEAEKAHFVGLSMGGRIAQDFCARYPGRVATLVLCDTMSDFRESMTPEKRAELIRLRQAPLKAGKEPRDIADALVDSLTGPGAERVRAPAAMGQHRRAPQGFLPQDHRGLALLRPVRRSRPDPGSHAAALRRA